MTENRGRNWALIAVGYIAGIAGYLELTKRIPPFETVLVAALLPTCAAVILVSATLILSRDSATAGNGALAKTYANILSAVILFIVTLHLLILAALLGTLPAAAWVPRAPIVLFGLLAIYVGNLLPRTRPNLALGIRTSRTLQDREAWISTHRIAGYLAVGLGVFFVAAGLFLSRQQFAMFVGPVSIAAALLLAAQHLRKGTRHSST